MQSRRKKISRARRLSLLQRSGIACALCAASLGAEFDLHHVRYVSLGGGDEDENLAALCPACHRNLAHGIYQSDQGRRILAEANQRWVSAVQVARRSFDEKRDPSVTAKSLSGDTVKGAILSTGAYRFLDASARILLLRLPADGARADRASRLNVLSILAAMSYYSGRGIEQSREQLAQELRQFDRSKELASIRNECRLALSRLYMVSRNHDEERRALEDFEFDGATDGQMSDWSFRAVSLERYSGADYARLKAIPASSSNDDVASRLLRASVLGELGKVATWEEKPEAVLDLRSAFTESFMAVHRRGMVMTALRLADLYIRFNDAPNAVRWWVVANYGGEIGELPELGLLQVKAALEFTFGQDFLKQAGVGNMSGRGVLEDLHISALRP